ncbi:MAG: Uma2 family endonuclease [Pyrinomonadaceae bacterium]|nr:Uma2 family endonuclease [Pyrinomonadaceae bacterium]
MATVLETTQKSAIPIPYSKSNGKPRVRSEESINRYLLKHKNYEYVNGKLEKKFMPNAKHSGLATRVAVELGIYLKKHKVGRVYSR